MAAQSNIFRFLLTHQTLFPISESPSVHVHLFIFAPLLWRTQCTFWHLKLCALKAFLAERNRVYVWKDPSCHQTSQDVLRCHSSICFRSLTAEEWNRKLCKCRQDEDENEELIFLRITKKVFLTCTVSWRSVEKWSEKVFVDILINKTFNYSGDCSKHSPNYYTAIAEIFFETMKRLAVENGGRKVSPETFWIKYEDKKKAKIIFLLSI